MWIPFSRLLSCTVFQILKKICFSIMAVLIRIHIICILYYNILSDSMIILDHGNICVDTNFMILSYKSYLAAAAESESAKQELHTTLQHLQH